MGKQIKGWGGMGEKGMLKVSFLKYVGFLKKKGFKELELREFIRRITCLWDF